VTEISRSLWGGCKTLGPHLQRFRTAKKYIIYQKKRENIFENTRIKIVYATENYLTKFPYFFASRRISMTVNQKQ
jgi:hypothetical protein